MNNALPKIAASQARYRRLVAPVAIFLCALGVRLAYLAQDASSPFFWHRLIDAGDYHVLGLRFANRAWPGHEALFRPPLYPLFLGTIYRFLGDDIVTLKALQATIGAFSCLLVYFIGRLAFEGRLVAIAAALLCAFCGTLVYYDLEPLSANLDVFLLLLTLWLLLRAARECRLPPWALAGAALGLAAVNRGSALVLLPFVLGWLWRFRRRPGAETAGAIKSAAVLLLSVGVVIAPLAWHNARYDEFPEARFAHAVLPPPPEDSTSSLRAVRRIVTGRFSPLGWADGINVYVGNIPEVQRINRDDQGQHFAWFDRLFAEPWQAGVRSASGHSRYFLRKTAAYVRSHPVAWVRLLVRKALQVVNGTEVPRGRRLYADRLHSSVLWVLLWRRGIAFPSGLLIPLGLLGLWLARASWRRHGLVAGALAAQTIFLLGFFVTARYRAPALPLLALYAAYVVSRALDLVRDRRAGLRAAAIFVVLLAACNLPLDPVDETPSVVEEYGLATNLEQQRRLDEAIDHYRAALRASGVGSDADFTGLPNTIADVHYNLGTALHRLGRLDEAIVSYRTALRLRPDSSAIQDALTQALADAQSLKGASPQSP